MHFSHNYRDDQAKASAVRENIQTMIMRSVKAHIPEATGDELMATNDIVRQWLFDHPNATITEVSDFGSRLIQDFREKDD